MERNVVWLGTVDEDGDLDDIHPLWGEIEVAKRLLDEYMAETPADSWKREDYIALLHRNGFVTIQAGSENAEFDAACKADKLFDLPWYGIKLN